MAEMPFRREACGKCVEGCPRDCEERNHTEKEERLSVEHSSIDIDGLSRKG